MCNAPLHGYPLSHHFCLSHYYCSSLLQTWTKRITSQKCWKLFFFFWYGLALAWAWLNVRASIPALVIVLITKRSKDKAFLLSLWSIQTQQLNVPLCQAKHLLLRLQQFPQNQPYIVTYFPVLLLSKTTPPLQASTCVKLVLCFAGNENKAQLWLTENMWFWIYEVFSGHLFKEINYHSGPQPLGRKLIPVRGTVHTGP